MTAPETSSPRERLERAVMGERPELTADDVAAAAGVERAAADRLWRALGFPDTGDEVAFTSADVQALTVVARTLEAGTLDLDTVTRMTRAIGQLIARLAEWEVATVSRAYEDRVRGRSTDDQLRLGEQLIADIGPSFEEMLVYAWRRHLAAAVARAESLAHTGGDGTDGVEVSQASVGFADLVAFTALTNRLGEDEIGDLVEVFESRCHDVVAGHKGRVIKTLGDSVLFVSESPAEAIDIGLDIIGVIGGDDRLPDVRVGVATGPVVLRMGDVYGPAVNLASRLTGVARRNRAITDQRTAGLLPPALFDTRLLPARPVRGFGVIEPVAVRHVRRRHAL